MAYLTDKKILIAGASSGIGAELARELVRRGARVGLLARRTDRLQELAQELGSASVWAEADVRDTSALEAACNELEAALGGVDMVIANAGYGHPELPHKFRKGAALAMYDTNVLGMLRLFDWALPKFLEKRAGHLVGVASMASFIGITNMGSYCGSKAAMRVHMQGLRAGLAPYGVAVTAICPGFVKSELTDQNKGPMPFFWSTERAARKIADALEKRRGQLTFPWQMSFLIGLAVRLPVRWVDFLLRRWAPKPR